MSGGDGWSCLGEIGTLVLRRGSSSTFLKVLIADNDCPFHLIFFVRSWCKSAIILIGNLLILGLYGFFTLRSWTSSPGLYHHIAFLFANSSPQDKLFILNRDGGGCLTLSSSDWWKLLYFCVTSFECERWQG